MHIISIKIRFKFILLAIAFDFRENSIVVTIPFNKNIKVGNKVGNMIGNTSNATRKHFLSEIRHNPNITKAELEIIF